MTFPFPFLSVGAGSSISGSITIGNHLGVIFGYATTESGFGTSFGSISGAAASYIGTDFSWSPSEMDGAALAKGTTTAKLVFQGTTYDIVSFGGGDYGWEFGPEVATWPTSGTHTFEIINP